MSNFKISDGIVIGSNGIIFSDGSTQTTSTANASNITSGELDSTLLANTGVTAGTYGSSTQVPVIVIDDKGRITSASNTNLDTNLEDQASESLNVQFDNNNAVQYKLVALNANSETVLASALNSSQIDRILGILDSSGETVTFGTITNGEWNWAPEASLYLGANGNIVATSTVDGAVFSLKIGTAISANQIFVKIGTPVIL